MKLAYREYGQGRPLLILHGLFGQSDNWNTLAKQFAGEGLQVFAIDQRNHGLSPHSPEWSYEVMARDLDEFITGHCLEAPLLLGHSMGGKTVMFFEHLFPGRASGLVIADIAARAYAPHHDQVLAALHAVDFNRISTRREAESLMSTYLPDVGTRQFLLKNIYWKDSGNTQLAWRFNLETITQQYDNIGVAVPDYVSAVPTLVVKGERSSYVSPQDETAFKKRFTNCNIASIAGAGHWVHAEKPAEFFALVRDFIKGLNR